jgi:hypothetical protein
MISISSFSQSKNIVSLAGSWKFKADSNAIGEAQHWEMSTLSGTIKLPGSTDDIRLGNQLPIFKSALGNKPPDDYPKDADYGMLTRKHKYIGVAWYQKKINIPANATNQTFSLYLERVLWRSKVWVDGKLSGEPIDYLSSPHNHALGILSAGTHVITLMIDNRQIYPIGTLGHSYCPHMQTEWNGAVGNILLISKPLLSLNEVKVFPSFKNKKINIDIEVDNRLSVIQNIDVQFILQEKKTSKIIVDEHALYKADMGKSSQQKEISLQKTPLPWDEFTPNLYQLTTIISYNKNIQRNITTFGFRDIGVADKHFTINGRKILYRNSHEGMFFGKTGYPAMDVAYWKKLFSLYKSHGLNAVRFHSSCPPEAAFTAADELGIYLQVEFFWIDRWMGYKDLIGGKNDTLNQFVRNELHQALNVYGNHPSMMLVAIGNELGGNFDKMGEWIAEEKKQDPRHFYAAGIAHKITTADDFVEYGGKESALLKSGTDWDYTDKYMTGSAHYFDSAFRRKNLPEYTHEMGQYVVHPLWSEIDQYNGVLAPLNLTYYRDKAKKNGIENMDTLFQKASGNLNRILYKAEIEATLRTSQSAGYGLLGMVDYPGQGEAYMGWVDPMYHEKNFITAEQFKTYGNAVVPLIRIPKYVWEDGDNLNAKIEVANFGPSTIKNAVLHYSVRKENKIIKEGKLSTAEILQGSISDVGEFSEKLSSGNNGEYFTININIEGSSYRNSWDIWVFPKEKILNDVPKNILVTTSIDDALVAMKNGAKVLLIANKLGKLENKTYAAFSPVFWSATWFEGQETEVSGAVIKNNHPAMKLFPTSNVTDWQWQDVCKNARGFDLSELPKNYFPIVEPVDDYHFGKKLGSIFELKTINGGKLLVCGYNIIDSLDKRPAARQLRKSLLAYISSADFHPQQTVDEAWLEKTFVNIAAPIVSPKGFESSILYVDAGTHHADSLGSEEWSPQIDNVFKTESIDYRVSCKGVLQDSKGIYWYGKKIRIEIDVKYPKLMELRLRLSDPYHEGREGTIICEDDPEIKWPDNGNDGWITMPITRENCLDGKIVIEANCTKGPDLMISNLILMAK